jgi:two-component system, chemotaxis family, protein-glutamate methylesterase/glutaminase
MCPPDEHSPHGAAVSGLEPGWNGDADRRRDIVVVGASAGGVEALSVLMGGLPPDLPAAVFVVLHLMGGRSMLAPILSRSGPIAATAAEDGERFARSHIYVAPPDSHMILEEGVVRLTKGPREKGCRPAIDPLFRSAARVYGPRVVGVVLSGLLHDGSEGLSVVKQHGGLAVVQDPQDAKYSAMPTAAIAATDIDIVAPVDRIARVLVDLVSEPISANAVPGAEEE